MSQPKNNPNSKLIIPAAAEPDSAEPTKTRAIDGKTLAGVLEEAKASPPALNQWHPARPPASHIAYPA